MKTFLITGGGSGIGLATARVLVEEGARVVVTGRSEERLAAAREELGVETVVADVSKLSDVEALMDRVGEIDGLFANAGIGVFTEFEKVTEEDVDRVLATNFKGVYFTVQRARLKPGASVVINASWTVHRGLVGASLYTASKAAVHSLARTLGAEMPGVRVNTVSPGFIATDMFKDNVVDDEPYRRQVVMGRLGEPEDVAHVVSFLLSDRAGYVTGQDFVVDGGLVGAIPA
ncbi:SDR family NAD(P)-dependent oxidoreductase [Lentzea nigeriaca]|uniref:SDR family NAD(P)-dependent oxidoreductase n=1 Tax=Lentzea nigeriaca TaxID=1128665 RepID=UPI00195BD1B7|nr:SDR family oxidoreductase [Lentzea nigeriaca]MBM7864540.1 NAD(P)-dependent dehydrogenase (short-subunit alcohol dehydrogenase family) [Lentzea nigeriaca]